MYSPASENIEIGRKERVDGGQGHEAVRPTGARLNVNADVVDQVGQVGARALVNASVVFVFDQDAEAIVGPSGLVVMAQIDLVLVRCGLVAEARSKRRRLSCRWTRVQVVETTVGSAGYLSVLMRPCLSSRYQSMSYLAWLASTRPLILHVMLSGWPSRA
jgi:hypothetical protein